jgi:hypothetical protein
MADSLPVVPARENLQTVVESNTLGGRVSGDETVSIDSLFSVTSPSKRAQDAITNIVSQMSGPEGYIERLIVDQDGNVVEGAHRLEALRRLGISEVPITRIVDPTASLDISSLKDAIKGAGEIHPDHVNQIMSQVGDMLASTGNNPEKVLEEYTFPEGYEKYFEAALNSVSSGKPRPTDQSNLPALIDAAAAASQLSQTPTDEPRPKGKGQMFRGIGSLMRRRMFPIVQAAQLGWETLTPEQRQGAKDFLNTPMHEFVGMEKSGLEYFKGLLGLGDSPGIGDNNPPGGIVSLPEGDDLTKSRMYGASPGSKPEYLGAGVDRSEHTYLRYSPKDLPEKTQKALDALRDNRNGIKDTVVSMVRRGQQLGGDSWYNTEELRDWFIAELGPERGHDEWREFMNLMGAASTGNKVPSNIAIASMYRSFGAQAAKKLARSHLEEGGDIPSGYGHKQQKNHALNVLSYYEGKWTPTPEDPEIPSGKGSWKKNPKPKGFAASLLGSRTNIAADLHFTRIMGMASEDPRYLSNSAEISDTLAQQLKAKYGRKITTRFLKKNKDGMWKLKARDAVIKGPANLGEFMGEAQVWQGRPDDVEYKAFEQFTNELAGELGMTGPQLQANLWMGAADVTGVDPASQGTFMELFRKRAQDVAEKTGTPTAEVIRNFIRNRGMFSEGGLITFGKGGFVDRPLYEDARLIG